MCSRWQGRRQYTDKTCEKTFLICCHSRTRATPTSRRRTTGSPNYSSWLPKSFRSGVPRIRKVNTRYVDRWLHCHTNHTNTFRVSSRSRRKTPKIWFFDYSNALTIKSVIFWHILCFLSLTNVECDTVNPVHFWNKHIYY